MDLAPDLTATEQLELALRLALALGLGAVIGLEREYHRQPAGFRTHGLVALGAALFTVVSAHAFADADPTRIAAQIVTGIGFIGAGTILHHRGSVRGLTTAASLWAVAAIGMTAGAGLMVLALAGTVLVLAALWLLDLFADAARRGGLLPPEEPGTRRGDGHAP
jgi:putative Mg2+ transporter-C (MgtC) family protein